MATERLQKILAAAGVASRRAAEEMILEGRVTVNGKRITELGTKADPVADHVKVDGKRLRAAAPFRYILMNKPRGVVVTRDDPQRRPTVYVLLGTRVSEPVVPVGRLDFDSEGLILLTNDGPLAYRIAHPSGGCQKEYEVKVSGVPTPTKISRLARGVLIDGVRTAPATVELIDTTPEKDGIGGNAWLRVVLGEGRSRQVRKMLESVGHKVSKLRRVAIGPIRDKSIPPGGFRDLSPAELDALRALRPAPKPARTSRPKPAPKTMSKPGTRPARAAGARPAAKPGARKSGAPVRRREVKR
jgi:23S rRNA pseudouridine2605 synthase